MKDFNFKQFLVNHGEKLALGFALLLVFVALFTTSWARYPGTPEELLDKTKNVEKKISQAEWPPDQQKRFDNQKNVRQDVDKMLRPLETASFQYKTEIQNPLYQAKAKIQEPEWLAVEKPIADAGRSVIEIKAPAAQPAGQPVAAADAAAAAKQAEEAKKEAALQAQLPEEFQKSEGREQRKTQKATMAKKSGPRMPSFRMRLGRRAEEQEIDAAAAANQTKIGQRRQVTTTGFGRGYRYVAVRGVFPLERQINQLKVAMSAPQNTDLSSKIKFIDFELQRQRAVPDSDPWSGEWEVVDLEEAKRVLREAVDYYYDDLDPGVVDSVITMPIPQLAIGIYGAKATHPDIENFKLTEEQKKAQQLIDEKLIAESSAKPPGTPQPEEVKVAGFGNMQYDARAMRQNLNAEDRRRVAADVAKDLNTTNTESIDKQLASAAGRLVLFRYFDFDVDPGHAYRYRIRLQLENPNRKRLVEEVAVPSVKEGATRWTNWSEPTPPVFVPPDTKYFVDEVTPARGRTVANAEFNMFQWMPVWGTVVNNKLRVDLGDFISGQAETDVLNPAKGEFSKEPIAFATDDMLVDVLERPKISPEQHPDLKLPTNARGRFEIPMQVLVVDKFGDLQSFDPVSRKEERNLAEERLKQERALFQSEFVEFVKQEKQNRLDEIAAKDKSKKAVQNQGDDDQGKRRSNPRRKRSG